MPHLNYLDCNDFVFTFQDQLNVKLKISDNLEILTSDIIGPVVIIIHHFDFQAERYVRIQGYW